jgi:hypothetical protein
MLQLRAIFYVVGFITLGFDALLHAQAPEVQRVQTKVSDWELEIPEYTGGEKSIDLQGSVNEIILGGGGQYVVMHTSPEEEIIVFDVSKGEIIYRFMADVGTMIAASSEFLITVTPFDKSVELRSFKNLETPRRMKLPMDCAVLKIAVGHASSGPMFVSWAEGTGDGDNVYLSFLQIPSLEPVIPRGVFQTSHGMNSTRAAIGRWGEFQGLQINHLRDKPCLRASASGDVFGCWSMGHSPSGLGVSSFDAGSLLTFYEHASVGHVAPSADGQSVCTAQGIYSIDLKRKRGEEFCVPTSHPRYLLTFPTVIKERNRLIDVTQGRIIDSESGREALQLPTLSELVNSPKVGEIQLMIEEPIEFAAGISLDKRFMLIPQAKALVTLHADNRNLRIRPVELVDSLTSQQSQVRRGNSKTDLPLTFATEKLSDSTTQIIMPGVIGDAIEAANGKYLLVHLAGLGQLIVMDAYLGTAVKVLQVPTDALIAASSNEIVVLSPFSRKLSRWDLGSLQLESEVTLTTIGQVDAIAMGSNSKGPLLLHWKNLQGYNGGFAFYDPRTLLPLKNPALTVVSQQSSVLVGENGANGEFVLPQYHESFGHPALRASVDGTVFGIANGHSVVMFHWSERSVTAHISQKSVLYATPSPDGLHVCTDDGYYAADMKSVRAKDPSVPSTVASLYLSLQNSTDSSTHSLRSFPIKGTMNSQETGRVMFDLPELAEMNGQYEFPQQGKKIALDRRYHLIAQSSLLVTIPPSSDRIILRKLSIPVDKGANHRPVAPEMRIWTDNTGKHTFKAALIVSKDDHVELRSADDRVVRVPLSRLSKFDLDFIKNIKGLDGNVALVPTSYSYLKVQGRFGEVGVTSKNLHVDGFKHGMQLMPTQQGTQVHVDGWMLQFEPEEGGFLKVGKFANAARFFTKDRPGISISGPEYGCNEASGEFQVLEIEFLGGKIHRLAIDFSQRCENQGPQLTGELRFNSTVP